VLINFGYLRTAGVYDRLSVISLWVIFIVAFGMFLLYFEKIFEYVNLIFQYFVSRVSPTVFFAILELFYGAIIINCSGIDFQEPTKIIIYAVSLIAVMGYKDKMEYINCMKKSNLVNGCLYILYAYAAFALVGQRIFIYPLTIKVTGAGIFVYIITFLWFVPIVNSILYYLNWTSNNGFAKTTGMKTSLFVFICTSILLLPALYNLFANNPGISSVDTQSTMISNAQNLHGMYDWHPAFYCMVLRVIEEISNTTYMVIAVQYFFWAYVMIELLLFLRKHRIRESILIGVSVFLGFNAANLLYINTIWKDIPYTLSIVWILIILAKLSIDYEEYRCKWYIYIEFIVAMVGACLYRKNGIVTFAIILLSVVIILRKNWKAVVASVIALVCVAFIKGPVYNYFEVVDSGRTGMYIGLGQDVLGVYYAGGEVSEETLEMITEMTNYNNDGYYSSYTPTWSKASYNVDVAPKDFVINYIDTFINNPVLMIRAVIDREDALWDIFSGKDSVLDCVNYYGTQDWDEDWNEYYPERHYVSMYTWMSSITNYTASSQWISAIEWRCGLFTLLGMISIFYVVVKKGIKRHVIIIVPLVGHVMSLLLSTGWSDFRYFWPMNLMNLALVMIVIVLTRNEANLRYKEKKSNL
jgi:hypothetical protein